MARPAAVGPLPAGPPVTGHGPGVYLRRTWRVPATDLACTSPVEAGDDERSEMRVTCAAPATRPGLSAYRVTCRCAGTVALGVYVITEP